MGGNAISAHIDTVLLLVGTLAVSAGLATYLTPVVRKGAIAFGVLDHPDGKLKQQAAPVPYLGGIAVYLAVLLALSLASQFSATILALLLGATIVTMVGLFDDLRVLTPGLKLAGQLFAAWVALRAGIAIGIVTIPAAVAWPLSVVWLVGITNALNILDVADGLAASVAATAAACLAAIAVIHGDMPLALVDVALAGALLGFLRYNKPPASIYLGDAGSLFVGFMLAAASLVTRYSSHNPWTALAPISVLAVPLFETALVTLARLRRGLRPWRGSPDHFALRLQQRGWSRGRIVWTAAAAGGGGGATSIAIVLTQDTAISLACSGALVAAAAAIMVALRRR